jgi:hypothetical protein
MLVNGAPALQKRTFPTVAPTRCSISNYPDTMVLERLWRSKSKDEPLEIDNPYAYSDAYEDCLSCRVLGMTCLQEQPTRNK